MIWLETFKHFILVLALSFLIGIEREEVRHRESGPHRPLYFGGVRTFPLIGLLGIVLYLIDPGRLIPYIVGLVCLSVLLSLHYSSKLECGRGGITTEISALLTYTLGPIVIAKPVWWPVGLTVITVLLLHSKPALHSFSRKIPQEEVYTAAKFLILIGIILPLLPKQKIPFLEISPYQIWLAVVAVSSISYISYIIQTYIFPRKGLFWSGFLGGIYSSTATTVVLAKRVAGTKSIGPIVLATGAMYLRLLALVSFFSLQLALTLGVPFLIASLTAILFAFVMYRLSHLRSSEDLLESPQNPLEIITALVFALVFVMVVALTRWVLYHYGQKGLNFLAGIIGFVDIDPFVLGIVQGKYHAVSLLELKKAIVLASISNNFAKAFYAMIFGGWRVGVAVLGALAGISLLVWLSTVLIG